jgi:CheY-like chemotaxis protein
METFIKLLEAVAKLAGALAWPCVVLIVLWWFGGAIRQFLANISEGSFKAFGIEGTAKRTIQQAIVSADLSKRDPETKEIKLIPNSVEKSLYAADYAANLLRTHKDFSQKRRRLLWVDDQPTNNVLEMKALEGLGFAIDMVVSTDEALHDIAKSGKYDVIISDMSRPDDNEAGRTLLRRLREIDDETPVIIYSSNDTPQFESEMKDSGAFAVTHLASELVIRTAQAVEPDVLWSRSRLPASQRVRHLRSSS